MAHPSLALVVPCHNEASRLAPQAFLDCAATHASVRFIFVDDGSVDDTATVLARLQQAMPESIRVMRLATRQGKAEAVRVGILEGIRAGVELVGFWDADLSTPLDAIDDFLAVVAKRPDMEVLLGSRVMLMGRDIRRLAWRHYVGRIFATAVSLTLRLPIYDSQCGAKLFRANDAVAAVFAKPFVSQWVFDVEVLARYLDQPVARGTAPRSSRIYELALSVWHHAPGSKLRWRDFTRASYDLYTIHRARRR